MKFRFQIQRFLANISFKSKADWEMIQIFASQYHCQLSVSPNFSDGGINISDFTEWFNNGFACGDVAQLGDNMVLLGECNLECAKIVAKLDAETISTCEMTISLSELSKVSQTAQKSFLELLSKQGLQFDRDSQQLTKKYIPSINERVEFYSGDTRGIGVIREFQPENNYVELYCYYIYDTKQIGYSMHEKGICTVHNYDFRPMNISAQRRLNRELERYGKKWYDKLNRIEPVTVKVEKGQKYWYINDKMKVIQELEKETPTSQFRYIAGNYFTSHAEATTYLGMFAELLRDRLAKPENKTEGQ